MKGACAVFYEHTIPREGELYKEITLAGHTFQLRYGYYEEHERLLCSPVVIFPDLITNPVYDPMGYPLVTQIQEVCPHYDSIDSCGENWCGDCRYFQSEHPELGVCRCEENKIQFRREKQ